MNMARELHELAQTNLDLIQDIQWNDLRRAVVIHLESMEEHDQVISHRIPTRQMCHHVINQKPCPKWTHGTHCEGTWHPEFLQILEDGHPKWIWMPRQTICRTDQRSKGVHCPAPIPTASVHMPPTGSTQNSGLSAGGWNMSSTLVLPQATHLTVTWLPCRPAQPMWHSPPCHTSTRPTTTSSARLHRFHSLKHMATWWWQHQVGEPTTSMNNLAEAELPHLAETRHPGGQSLHRDQSWSVLMLLQHQPQLHQLIHGYLQNRTWKKTHGQEPSENMPNNKKLGLRLKLHLRQLQARHQSQHLQWHPPSTRHANTANTGLRRHRSTELSRRSARPQGPQYTPSLPFCRPRPTRPHTSGHTCRHQSHDTVMEPDQWFSYHTFSTEDPRYHSRSLVRKATDPIHTPIAPDTHPRNAVPLEGRQQLPIEQSTPDRVYILAWEPLPSEHGFLGHHHPWQHDSTSARSPTLRPPSADTYGLRDIHRRCLPAQVLVAPTSPDRQECGTRALRQ